MVSCTSQSDAADRQNAAGAVQRDTSLVNPGSPALKPTDYKEVPHIIIRQTTIVPFELVRHQHLHISDSTRTSSRHEISSLFLFDYEIRHNGGCVGEVGTILCMASKQASQATVMPAKRD